MGVGDACWGDSDGEGVTDNVDLCPYNPSVQDTSFRQHTVINLNPRLYQLNGSEFKTSNSGKQVTSDLLNASVPLLLIGRNLLCLSAFHLCIIVKRELYRYNRLLEIIHF